MGDNGKVLAREEYNEKKQQHTLWSKVSGEWVAIYEMDIEVPVTSICGVGADSNSLLFVDARDDKRAIFSMSPTDGSISGPLFYNEDADVDDLFLDLNRKLEAVADSGFKPSYEFTDPKLNALFGRVELTFHASSVFFESSTEDNKSIVVLVSAGDAAGKYYLFDSEKVLLSPLASQYKIDEIGEIKAIRYSAKVTQCFSLISGIFGNTLRCAYICMNPEFPGYSSGVSPDHPSFDEYCAIIEFNRFVKYKFGAPSDEEVYGHRLSKLGVEPYGFYKLSESPELELVNDRFLWVAAFHDETLQVVAPSMTVLASRVDTCLPSDALYVVR